VNRFCSIFSQLLKLFPRLEFEQAVRDHHAEYHSRGFSCWSQFVAMLFLHLSRAESLREICGGLASSESKLAHLGLLKAPPRSTLSYANKHRPWELYATVFDQLLEKCHLQLEGERSHPRGGGRRFRFRHRLMSLDASVISLCEEVFDWAEYHRGKGAVKLHLLLDHEAYLPRLAVLSGANEPEVNLARQMSFPRGAVLLCDAAYTHYQWFDQLCDEGVWFVTPLRRHAHFEVIRERKVKAGSGVISDCVIRLGAERRRMRNELRLVVIEREDGEPLRLLTNHLRWAAATVGRLYEQRWQIEQFFRLLKQNLRIRSFVGTSANAVLTQIWTALIALLLLKYLKLRARYAWSLSNLVGMLRLQLFVHRDLQAWLDDPYQPPPAPREWEAQQLKLSFARPN